MRTRSPSCTGKSDVGMRGVHREVVRPQRLVRSETWEDWDAGKILETTVLTERGRRVLPECREALGLSATALALIPVEPLAQFRYKLPNCGERTTGLR